MAADTHTIEVDAETAEMLSRRASERGLTIPELVAEFALIADAEDVSELERRSQAISDGKDKTVPHDEVARWLKTWGTPAFRPWSTK